MANAPFAMQIGAMADRLTWMDPIWKPRLGIPTPESPSIPCVPRTEVERQKLVNEKPEGWRYLLLAAELRAGRDALETRFLEYDIGYTRAGGSPVDEGGAGGFVAGACAEARVLLENFRKLASTEVQERVLGSDESADPRAVAHLAGLWTSSYGGLLDCALRIRGTPRPARWDRLFGLLERTLDGPIRQYRAFVDEMVKVVDDVPEAVANGRRFRKKVVLRLPVDRKLAAELSAELGRLAR